MSWAPTNEEFSARIAEYNRAQARPATSPSSAKILHLPPNGAESPPANDDFTLTLQDFVAYMPMHNYVCLPTREFWPAASVNSRIAPVTDGKKSVTAGAWLDANAPVEQATWAPGKPMLIYVKVISDGGWIDQPKFTVLNLYRPPIIEPRPGNVDLWVDHIRRVYGEVAADHMITCFAHRVQRPWEKINHALVLGGLQGIGKDTILEPVAYVFNGDRRLVGESGADFKWLLRGEQAQCRGEWRLLRANPCSGHQEPRRPCGNQDPRQWHRYAA
jgi:hypothetical protein